MQSGPAPSETAWPLPRLQGGLPADEDGIELRVPEIPVYVEMARALGTNPTSIPAGKVYTALQTGVVDGMEAPADFVESTKLYEVARHVTRTYHIMTEVSLMASAKRVSALRTSQLSPQASRTQRNTGPNPWR